MERALPSVAKESEDIKELHEVSRRDYDGTMAQGIVFWGSFRDFL
ncbi:MAG: hypothetical protein AAGA77_19510 [Bacteroidota bacterium]